jgi:hypothetical protein
MFSQLAQQNKEQRVLNRSEGEFDRSVDLRADVRDTPSTVGSMTDSYLQW